MERVLKKFFVPKKFIDSSQYTDRLRQILKKEKSSIVGLQEVKETITILGKNLGKESKDQRKSLLPVLQVSGMVCRIWVLIGERRVLSQR